MHTDHWIIILYNCCIPWYYFSRILYGSELYHIDNNSKKWHLSSSCIRSYRILFGFLHNVAEKLEWFCQKLVVCLHSLLYSSENGQQSTADTPSRFAIEISDCDLQKVHFWPFPPTTCAVPQDSTMHFKRAGSVMLNTVTIATPKLVNWKSLKPCWSNNWNNFRLVSMLLNLFWSLFTGT